MNKEHAIQLTSFIKRFEEEKPLYTIQTQPLTMMPHNYGAAITDFLDYFFANKLTHPDYYDIEEQFQKKYKTANWLHNLNEQQVMQCISLIIRREKFVDGFVASMIENGSLLVLLNRLKELYGINLSGSGT
jgi:hypothetical protein